MGVQKKRFTAFRQEAARWISLRSRRSGNIWKGFSGVAAVTAAVAFGWAGLASATQPAATKLPRAPQAQLVDVTPTTQIHGEPSIAINPNNPKQLVAGYQRGAKASYSVDGGLHWMAARGAAKTRYRFASDPALVFDNKGHAFDCYLSFAGLPSPGYWAHEAAPNGLFVRRSLDGGKTWGPEITIRDNPAKVNYRFEDKAWIGADDSPKSPHAGNLYIGWTRYTLYKTEIDFVRSTDDGQTWSKPMQISTVPGLPRGNNGALEGFTIAVGPHGTVYAAWDDIDHIVFTKSTDGGRTFSPSRRVIKIGPLFFGGGAGVGLPSLAIDPKSGRLYVCWSDYRLGEVDVFVAGSRNGGASWSAPVKVNSDPAHDYAPHEYSWLAVDPVSGDLYVLFYDWRDDPYAQRKTMVTLARSTNHGRTFTNYSWTARPFDNHGAPLGELGDYTGLVAYGGRVWGIWSQIPAHAVASHTAPIPNQPPWYDWSRYVRVGMANFGR